MKANKTLGDLAEYITVGYVGSMSSEYVDEGVPFLRSLNVNAYSYNPHQIKYISKEFHQKIKKSSLRPGDVVAVRTGNPGVSCVVPDELPDANCSDLVVIRCGDKLDPHFVSYYINSVTHSHVRNQLVGAIQKHFNIGSAKELPFPNLDKDQQISCSQALRAINKKIALNNKINTELEAMAKLIYDYWFVQFDFPDANGKPYKSSGGKMVYNEALKREIPEGWGDGSLNDLGEIVGGSTPSTKQSSNFSENGIPWITPKDLSKNTGNKFITRGSLDVSESGAKSASLSMYPINTVLMSSRAPIGYMAIAREPLTTNQGFKSFIPNKGYSPHFIYYAVSNSMKAIIQYSSGSTFKEVSGSTLKTVKICLPKNQVVVAYTDKVAAIFERQNLLELENEKLVELRDWLLPMLMNGQVTVKDTAS